MRINKLWHVFAGALGSAFAAVVVPFLVFGHMLGWLPVPLLTGLRVVTSVTIFAIAFPFALLSLNAMRRVNTVLGKLEQAVRFDPLTGVMTRTHFLMSAEDLRARGGCLVIADADRFKSINDTFGHEAGDLALKHLSHALQHHFDGHGVVGRLGGEEFGIYLRKTSLVEAKLLLSNLGTALRLKGFEYEGKYIQPTMSFGLVQDVAGLPLASMMRRADECLYKAKELGRDRFVTEDVLDQKAVAAA